MLYKKQGLPEDGEIIICTVERISSHTVFVKIDGYDNLEGMIHISEISPGRIRNLRDFVKEGKKIVCKVLKIRDVGHIELSLRRVTTSYRINKLNEYKQEEKAEKLLEQIGKKLKLSLEDMYKQVGYKAIEKYGLLNAFFNQISVEGEKPLAELKIDKKISKLICEIIQEKIKPIEIKVQASLILKSFSPNGIDQIKKALSLAKNSKITYISAPKYNLEIISTDYKIAENLLKEDTDKIIKEITASGGEAELIKDGS